MATTEFGSDAVSIWRGNSKGFNDPFMLPSNQSMPTELESALDFCLYLYFLNPLYRRASHRVVSHFITDIEFEGESGDQGERDDLKSFLKEQMNIFGMMLEMGQEWACFQGDTKVVCEHGVFPIRELVGKTVKVLSKDGIYREAPFKSYGVQPLMEVEFSDGRIVKATPEHKWPVRNGAGNIVEVTTEELRPKSHRIKRTVAPRPEKNSDYYEGVRHGFVFGDGSKHGNKTAAMFCGDKYKDMIPYFDGQGTGRILPRRDRNQVSRLLGLKGHYKELPDNQSTASYWYGFVSGFLAADGTVDSYGCVVLTQADKSVLRVIEAQLPRIGMVAGPIRTQIRDTEILGRHYKNHEIHCMTLLKNFMKPEDILLRCHRKKFNKKYNPNSKYGQWMRIKDVRRTDIKEEVFCCVEMETHHIVIENGVETMQCFGNGFCRIHFPFDRVLVDNRNGKYAEYSLPMFGRDVKYDYKTMTYEVPDPRNLMIGKKRKMIKLPFIERPAVDWDRIKLRKIDPRQVTLQHSFMSGRTQILYRFESEFVRDIQKGVLHQVNETPMSMLKALAKDQDFLFNDGQVFHFKSPTVSGVSNHGWGMPETLANYRHLHQLQIYRKIDEAVGMDYMLPFRLFSPHVGENISDATTHMLLGRWSKEIKELIKRRRSDMFAMHALPFPVTYQEMGAEGKNLAPKDLIEFQTNDMLDAMGYPAELFRGTLQVQQIPTTLRLFENSFHFIHHNFNNMLKWVVRRVLDYVGQEQMGVSMQLPSMADDLEQRHIYLQLAAGQEIPRDIAYKPFGIKDPVEAAKRRIQEDVEIQKEQQKIQEDAEREATVGSMDAVINAQAEAQGQGAGAGSMPQQGGMDAGGMTPVDIQQQAMQIAQQLVQQDQGSNQKQLSQIKASNPNLHALVKEFMQQIRSDASSQGRASLKGGGPGGAPM